MWYGRFKVYLSLGPTRTLRDAARRSGEAKQRSAYGYSSHWTDSARQWRWAERADGWDLHQRELLTLSERNRRLALHGRRVDVIENYLETVREVLDNANLAEADQQQARQWLPQMRHFLLELLIAERQEFERIDYERNDADNSLVITADDLRAAQRALEAQARACDSGETAQPAPRADQMAPVRTLCVCVGPDHMPGSALMLDLAALRAVRSATGLKFIRLLNATRYKFADTLRRERSLGRPVELLHLALHASPDGVEFADGVADGNWLSEWLFGVRIMLLASCEGDGVGEWLGVVPHVVTLSEEISHEDAAVLTQHFWHNIGLNMEPGAALDGALGHCPPAVGEYVVRHW